MNIDTLMNYLSEYGLIILFVIVLLEYMNLPGFPAGIIMPLSGMWISNGEVNFILGLAISVLAGLIGSWILYFIGKYGGEMFLKKYISKFPSHEKYINRNIEFLKRKENAGIFLSKLMPVMRTIVSIPAGVIKVNFLNYTIYSALGILVWNTVFIGAGYFFGEAALKFLS